MFGYYYYIITGFFVKSNWDILRETLQLKGGGGDLGKVKQELVLWQLGDAFLLGSKILFLVEVIEFWNL